MCAYFSYAQMRRTVSGCQGNVLIKQPNRNRVMDRLEWERRERDRAREGENICEALMLYACFVLTLSFIPRTFIILAASVRPDDSSAHLCTCPKRPLQQHTSTERFHFMDYGNHLNLWESSLSLFVIFRLAAMPCVYLLRLHEVKYCVCVKMAAAVAAAG